MKAKGAQGRVRKWAQILADAAAGRSAAEIEQIVMEFYKTIKEENALYLSTALIKFLEQEQVRAARAVGLKVTVAQNLPPELKTALSQKFSVALELISVHQDAELIGGLKVEHRDVVYDFSLKNQVASLKKILSS